MKGKIFMLILFGLMFSSMVSAQQGTGFLGGMEGDILTTVNNIISFPLTLPNLTGPSNVIPFWMAALGFALIFSIIWLAAGNIPLFKNADNKGPLKIFSIAFSLIVVFSTNYLNMLYKMIGAFTSLGMLAFLVVGIYMIWVLAKGGWATGSRASADASKSLAEAAQISSEAKRDMGKAQNLRHRTAQALNKGLKSQVRGIRSLRSDLERINRDLVKIRAGKNKSSFLRRDLSRRIYQDVSRISKDLGKILSFETENDRLMSGMKSQDYTLQDASTIPLNTSDSDTVSIQKKVASETNDLGRIISGLALEIKDNGVSHRNAPKLIEWSGDAINITHRMERDIVLEEQMIDKI